MEEVEELIPVLTISGAVGVGTVELDGILDRTEIEDFCVDNGDRPLREVALEVLKRAGWPRKSCRASRR